GLRRWSELADGARAETVPGPGWCGVVQFTPDGRWLFAAGFALWRIEVATGAAVSTQPWNRYHPTFALSPDSRFVLLGVNFLSSRTTNRLACRPVEEFDGKASVWERRTPGAIWHSPHYLPGGKQFVRKE